MCCTSRCFFIGICVALLLVTVEKQVFDFLGYMWSMILTNFLQIFFTLIGFFGGWQCRARYIVAFLVFQILWILWSVFLLLYYLDVSAITELEPRLLSFGITPGYFGWWQAKGHPGCLNTNNVSSSSSQSEDPSSLSQCVLWIELIHVSVLLLLSLLSFIFGVLAAHRLARSDSEGHHLEYIGQFDKGRDRRPNGETMRSTNSSRRSASRNNHHHHHHHPHLASGTSQNGTLPLSTQGANSRDYFNDPQMSPPPSAPIATISGSNYYPTNSTIYQQQQHFPPPPPPPANQHRHQQYHPRQEYYQPGTEEDEGVRLQPIYASNQTYPDFSTS